MSTPTDSIIAHWNRSFRGWSENYIKPYKTAIIENCSFRSIHIEKGHRSALREIEKNKGNISQFVSEKTERRYSALLPSSMLSDAYAFMEKESDYEMVYSTTLNRLISWKAGTSNALSKNPLDIHFGEQHFECKFRKYQLESMKKFIQATPGTKEIKGQWAVNVADDAMIVSFDTDSNLVVLIKIGCFYDKLNIQYEENSALRKNSKIRKQTLKTSCWGLEKTRACPKFENSIIIQENYVADIVADDVLAISPLVVYVRKDAILKYDMMQINEIDINLHKTPFHIENIVIPSLSTQEEEKLRGKYRNTLLNGGKKKNNNKNSDNNNDDFYPIKPIEEEEYKDMEIFNPIKPFAFYNSDNDELYPWHNSMNMMNMNEINEMDEIQRLRQENELLLQKVAEQQQHIAYLASQIETDIDIYHRQRHNPLKRRRISVESLLPPAA